MRQVVFDIMTGLETRVSIPPGFHHTVERYLTPFFNITLGLLFILMATACGRQVTSIPDPSSGTQPANASQGTHPPQFGTQANAKRSPSPLPNIPATPNALTPSPLGVTTDQLIGQQVSLWYPWKGETGAAFQALLDEFNRNNKYGILITAEAYEDFGSLDDAMETAISLGPLPDVLVDYGYQARQWDASGILLDLVPYVDDPVWGLNQDEQADFYSSFWSEDLVTESSQPNARRLGIPYYRSAYVLFYNQTWATELGYPDPPNTPEDFRVRACAAAESVAKRGDKTNLGKGGWLITPEPGALIGWIYAFGGGLLTSDGKSYQFNTPETNQAFTYLKGLQQSGCAWADSQVDAQTVFANRQAIFVVSSLFDISSQRSAFTQASSNDEWTVLPFPSARQPVVDTYGPSLLITHSTPAKQLAAWLVIDWLVYPPNQGKFVSELEAFPTRQSTQHYLAVDKSLQWVQSLGWLADGRSEPWHSSWSVMRWAFSDASAQLFSSKFTIDQIPTLIANLDEIASEINQQVP